jgi:hypothetical protein
LLSTLLLIAAPGQLKRSATTDLQMIDKTQKDESKDEVFEFPVDGPWRAIAHGKDCITYYPRNHSKLARFEWTLPSGQVLIDDVPQGFVLRAVYTDRFNLKTGSPVGRVLSDRGIIKRQTDNKVWFVSWYQEIYDSEDLLKSSCLKLVEEHIGRTLLKRYEFDGEKASSCTPLN